MTNHADKLTYWSQHREAWQASDLTQQAYCEREGLSFASFGYWTKHILRAQRADAGDSTVPSITLVRAIPSALITESIELRSPNGWQVRLPSGINYASLAQLLVQLS